MVLTRISALATERGWSDLTHFIEALPDSRDRELLLLAPPDVDAQPLRQWIEQRDRTTSVEVGCLSPAFRDRTQVLTSNCVIAVLQCGELLSPDAVEAAAAVVHRPMGTFAVVLVGAEIVRSAEDLDVVQRGIWRLLIGDPHVEWSGQDLAKHGCLLWSDHTVADVASAQVAQDMKQLEQWIQADRSEPDALAQMRAWYALDLAEQQLARHAATATKPPAPGRGAISGLLAATDELRRRLLRRLDADVAVMELQVATSVQVLEQNLLSGVEEYLDQHAPEPMSGPALTAAISAYLADGSRAWRDDAVELVAARLSRTSDETGDLLDAVDWEQVNAVIGHTRRGSYPEVLLDQLAPQMPVSVPEPGTLGGPAPPGETTSVWAPALRRAVFGAVAAATSVVVLGPELVPAMAAGAIGAASAAAIDVRVSEIRGKRAALNYARAAIAATMGEFARTVRDQIRQSTEPVRRSVTAAFSELDAALHGAATQGAVTEQVARTDTTRIADTALLAELRSQL